VAGEDNRGEETLRLPLDAKEEGSEISLEVEAKLSGRLEVDDLMDKADALREGSEGLLCIGVKAWAKGFE
jgi:hypothetical protein